MRQILFYILTYLLLFEDKVSFVVFNHGLHKSTAHMRIFQKGIMVLALFICPWKQMIAISGWCLMNMYLVKEKQTQHYQEFLSVHGKENYSVKYSLWLYNLWLQRSFIFIVHSWRPFPSISETVKRDPVQLFAYNHKACTTSRLNSPV